MLPANRRAFLKLSGASCAATAWPGLASGAQTATTMLIHDLRDPPLTSRPQIRWWWPGGAGDIAILRREANAIADAGFGGFEVADVRDSVHHVIDPATQGWASPAWNARIETVLEEAVKRNLTMSITLGPHWPTGIPGVHPDDDAAAKEMVHGTARVAGGQTFTGPIPAPVQTKPSGWIAGVNELPSINTRLIAVQAWRVLEDKPVPLLDSQSRIDLTGSVRDGALNWQAPAEGDWLLLSFWMRGTGQIQNMFGMNHDASMLAAPTPYVLDIYGTAAVTALTRFWDQHLLTPKMRALLPRAHGTFFEDSLEMSAACAWTPGAEGEFARRCGYDLTPLLPCLTSRAATMEDIITGSGRPSLFRLTDIDATRVRHDYEAMLSSLYIENRIGGVARWAQSLGLNFRVQAVGSEINSGRAAAYAPIPEGDNSNDIHGWRRMAAGRDIGGRKILSDEAGTFVKGMAHVAVWQDLLYMLQRDMAGGANQMVIHGFSHAVAPGAAWPGFSAFGRAIGNDWGPRDPNWTMAAGVTAYIGRLQHVLRQGVNRCDLAVLGGPLHSQSVLHAGYTFGYPDMDLLALPKMVVRAGRLMSEGPAYRALVLNELPAIDPAAARRVLAYSEAGLPVVIVGAAPARARGWHDHIAADAQVAATLASLLARSNVRQVQSQQDVPVALAKLGVPGTIGFSQPDRVLAIHRQSGDVHLLYLLNDSEQAVRQTITIALPGVAHQLDLWSGEFKRVNGRAGIDLHLAPNEPAVLMIAPTPLTALPADTAQHQVLGIGTEGWDVTFDDWHAGLTVDAIRHQASRQRLPQLQPWSRLPGLQGMAGTAAYSTRFHLAGGHIGTGSELSLGIVQGTATVSVNGSPAQVVNPFTGKASIGRWLKTGENHLTVTVASSLNNRLVADHVADFAFGDGAPPGAPASHAEPVIPPDMIDGPKGMAGMQPGSAPPGGRRTIMPFGLIGPVSLSF